MQTIGCPGMICARSAAFGKAAAHLDHPLIGRVDQVAGQAGDVGEDLRALQQVQVGKVRCGDGVAEQLPRVSSPSGGAGTDSGPSSSPNLTKLRHR